MATILYATQETSLKQLLHNTGILSSVFSRLVVHFLIFCWYLKSIRIFCLYTGSVFCNILPFGFVDLWSVSTCRQVLFVTFFTSCFISIFFNTFSSSKRPFLFLFCGFDWYFHLFWKFSVDFQDSLFRILWLVQHTDELLVNLLPNGFPIQFQVSLLYFMSSILVLNFSF